MSETPPTLTELPGWPAEPPSAPVAAETPPAAPETQAEGETPPSGAQRNADGTFKAKEAPAEEGEEGGEPAEEAEDAPDEDAPVGEDGKARTLEPWQVKRIAREKRKTDRALTERDAASERLETLQALINDARETKALREPEPGDFDTAREFADAQDRWKRLADAVGTAKRPAADVAEFPDAVAELKTVVTAADKALWQSVIDAGEDLTISQHMVVALADADDPAAALRALRDDPAEAKRISKLTPARQMMAVLGLKPKPAAAAAPAAEPAKRVTQADDPPGAIPTRSAPVRDPSKMSQPEYEAWRAEQEPKERFGW